MDSRRALQLREIADANAAIDQANSRIWLQTYIRDHYTRLRDELVRGIEREDEDGGVAPADE